MNRKIFLTYTEQIDKLKNEKALIINDVPYAASVLKKLSYYSLIGGYKAPFRASAAQNSFAVSPSRKSSPFTISMNNCELCFSST